MRLDFKKDFLLVTAMLVAAGCSDSMTEANNPEQQVPIAFGTQVATRSVVESDKEGMDNFTLWGWVRESDGPKLFFDAASVTPSGNYGEKRFWAVGRPYDFLRCIRKKWKRMVPLPKFPATTRANSGLRVLILPEWGRMPWI